MKKIIFTLSIFCLLGWASEDEFISLLSQKLERYNKEHPLVQVQLVFNQDKYVPGDTVFFRAYVLNENFLPLKDRKIFTLELTTVEGQSLSTINFRISEGKAANQIILPPGMGPGVYRFSVYPLSYSGKEASLLFTKKLTVVSKNKLQLLDTAALVLFYPEGGRLISDVENHMLIQSSVSGKGIIFDEKNNEAGTFQLEKSGWSEMYFTPQQGISYYAKIENRAEKFTLNKSTADGCALRVSSLPNGSAKVKIAVSDKSGLAKKDLYLVVASRRRITYSSKIDFDNNQSYATEVSRENLPRGLSQIVVFDKSGSVLAERNIYNSKTNNVVTITPSKKVYKQREKVNVEFSLRDKEEEPIEGEFSVSVVNRDFRENGNELSFIEELLLASLPELKDHINLSNVADRLDLVNKYLLASDFKLFSWNDILLVQTPEDPAKESLIRVKGRAVFKSSGKPVPDSTLILGFLQNTMIGYETHTTKNGLFDMPFLYDFFGEEDLFYSMESKGKPLDQPYIIIPQNKTDHKIWKGSYVKEESSVDTYADYMHKKKTIDKSYRFFSAPKEKRTGYKNLNEKIEDELMGADYTVNVQDYVVFPNMKELIKEVIPFLEFRQTKKDSTMRLRLNQPDGYIRSKSEPLFVIDGILTKNKSFFMKLKPVDILKVKIINNLNKLTQFGALGKNGIVLVETKRGQAYKASESTTTLKITGMNQPLDYYIPDYSKFSHPRVPDLRPTLFWTPTVRFNSSGKASVSFYTSDDVGSFVVRIKGIAKNGEPFETESVFEVAWGTPSDLR
ncbi:MAG: hypothetical protein HYR67_09250 [Bacteroidetes bacterium]|nr:hypothetical protein [Bacteroidota bacterium]